MCSYVCNFMFVESNTCANFIHAVHVYFWRKCPVPENTHAHEKGEVSCHGGIDQDLKAEITF